MIIQELSYLHRLLSNPDAADADVISVSLKELRQYGDECERIGNFNRHPYYLSVKDVADYLRVAQITVYGWIKSGKLQAIKEGKSWKIAEVDVMTHKGY